MALIGQIGEFNVDNEAVTAYLERLGLFLAANQVEDERKVAVFLSVVGSRTYGLLRSLFAPARPQDKSLKELMTALEKYYEPKRMVIAERFYFHRRNQLSGESVAQYVAELRRLATHCNFGVGLDEALRDRFVCGINDERTQKRLLTDEDLTLAKAVALAQGREAAEKNAQQFKEPEIAAKAIGAANKRNLVRVVERSHMCLRDATTSKSHVTSVVR